MELLSYRTVAVTKLLRVEISINLHNFHEKKVPKIGLDTLLHLHILFVIISTVDNFNIAAV